VASQVGARAETEPTLTRQLGLFDSIMLMVGIAIGSGIFLMTGSMAESLASAGTRAPLCVRGMRAQGAARELG